MNMIKFFLLITLAIASLLAFNFIGVLGIVLLSKYYSMWFAVLFAPLIGLEITIINYTVERNC